MRICLILEGSYPYVHGGVSTWMHAYIQAMQEHEFVLWVIGAKAEGRGKFVYDLPSNVVEVEEIFLDDALRLHGEHVPVLFTEEERTALRELLRLGTPDWDVLFRLFQQKKVHPLSFLQSREFMKLFTDICLEEYPYVPYADAFHTMRSMLLPVLYLLTGRVPKAQIYHAISTGYGGRLACLGGSMNHAPVLLTEHGIYTREREEEIIRADWVVPSFKSRWIRFFYMLSEDIYRRAFRVSSLFYNARRTQIEMGCDGSKCIVIPNGVQYQRFCDIPLKPEDGWVDIGAVVRLAPIKDIKTMIYAFFELSSRVPQVRLHIMVGMCVLTCMVTLAISTNVVISLGMVGALSIVRFRTAVKDPLDLLYLFWSITTGITAGAGMYALGLVTAAVMIGMILFFYHWQAKGRVYIAVIHYLGTDAEDDIVRAFGRCKFVVKSKTMRKDSTEMAVEVFSKDPNLEFTDRLRAVNGVQDVTLIQYNGEYHG